MPDRTPDEHAAEAERLLGQIHAYVGTMANDEVTALAHVAYVHALLASQPTPPDNELVRRAIADETAELRAENERLRARLVELIDAMGGFNTPAIRDQIERALAVIRGEPVPSSGQDQTGECRREGCTYRQGHTGLHEPDNRPVWGIGDHMNVAVTVTAPNPHHTQGEALLPDQAPPKQVITSAEVWG